MQIKSAEQIFFSNKIKTTIGHIKIINLFPSCLKALIFKKKKKKYIYVFKEVNSSSSKMTYKSSLNKITLNIAATF